MDKIEELEDVLLDDSCECDNCKIVRNFIKNNLKVVKNLSNKRKSIIGNIFKQAEIREDMVELSDILKYL